MEKSKNNSNYNYTSKLKIGSANNKEESKNEEVKGFEMQKGKSARSATTAVGSSKTINLMGEGGLAEEAKVMEDNKVKLSERGEKTDNLLKKV